MVYRLRKLLVLAAGLSLALILATGPAAAMFYLNTQITNNNYSDLDPRTCSNGQIVWHGWDGNDWEIYLFDHRTTFQLTNNSRDDMNPMINARGQIAWSGFDGNDWEVFFYQNGTTTQLTNNSFDDAHSAYLIGSTTYYWGPIISDWGGNLVWSGGAAGNREIYACNIYGGNGYLQPFQVTNNSLNDDFPITNDYGNTAWVQLEGNDYDLWEWIPTPSSSTTVRVTNNSYNDAFGRDQSGNPVWQGYSINSSGNLAYCGYDGTNWEVYFYNLSTQTSTPLSSSNNSNYHNTRVLLNDDNQVVWAGGLSGNREIFLWQNGQTTQITNNSTDDYTPVLSREGQIAWGGWDGQDSEIYTYVAGTTLQVTNDAYDVGWYRINREGQIVYEAKPNGSTWEIFRADPFNATTTTYHTSAGQDFTGTAFIGPELGIYTGKLSTNPQLTYTAWYSLTGAGETWNKTNQSWDSWQRYLFYANLSTGVTFAGVGYNTDDFGYEAAISLNNPGQTLFTMVYQKTGGTQDSENFFYLYSFTNGPTYYGNVSASLPSGYYFGFPAGNTQALHIGAYMFDLLPNQEPGSYGMYPLWGMVNVMYLVEELY